MQGSRGAGRHEAVARRSPVTIDEHDAIATMGIVGMRPGIARTRGTGPVAARPDPLVLPGPVAADPDGADEGHGGRGFDQDRRRVVGNEQRVGLDDPDIAPDTAVGRGVGQGRNAGRGQQGETGEQQGGGPAEGAQGQRKDGSGGRQSWDVRRKMEMSV